MNPRLSFVSVTGDAASTTDTRLAAALYALDVPFDTSRMAATFAGDGIRGKHITWFFQSHNPHGQSSAAMSKAWNDDNRITTHSDCPIAKIKLAFRRKDELTAQIIAGGIEPFAPSGPFIETHDTAKAASMEQLGHPMTGIAYRDGKYWWRFAQAAAPDFALWDLPGKELEQRLPEALIAYLQCSFTNHRAFVDIIKKPKAHFATVQHRGRTAVIGNEMPKADVDKLEQLLTRPR